RRNGVLFRPLLLLLIVSVFSINFNVLMPVFAKSHLGQDARGFGFLMSAMGLGALIGAGILVLSSKYGPRPILVYGGACALCVFQILMPLTHTAPLASAMILFAGMGMIVFISTINTTLQMNSDDEYRGRVMSLYMLVFGGSTPIGSPVIGFLAQRLGVEFALYFSGAVGLFATAAFAVVRTYTRRRR
ncbi:MAG: MFS transporter, partial [bacterium]